MNDESKSWLSPEQSLLPSEQRNLNSGLIEEAYSAFKTAGNHSELGLANASEGNSLLPELQLYHNPSDIQLPKPTEKSTAAENDTQKFVHGMDSKQQAEIQKAAMSVLSKDQNEELEKMVKAGSTPEEVQQHMMSMLSKDQLEQLNEAVMGKLSSEQLQQVANLGDQRQANLGCLVVAAGVFIAAYLIHKWWTGDKSE